MAVQVVCACPRPHRKRIPHTERIADMETRMTWRLTALAGFPVVIAYCLGLALGETHGGFHLLLGTVGFFVMWRLGGIEAQRFMDSRKVRR